MNLRNVLAAALLTACAHGVDDEPATVPPVAPDPESTIEDAGSTSAYDSAPTDEPETADGSASSSDGSRDAATDAKPDAASPPDAALQDVAADGPSPLGCTVVINELMTGVSGGATNEFVEIYNPCSAAVDITDFTLVYRAGTSNAPNDASHDAEVLFRWASGSTVPSRAFLVYGGTGFSGTKDGALKSGLKDSEGAVAIRDGSGRIADAVGYGAGTINPANAFIEGTAAAANALVTAPGQSIGRRPDGADTDDNGADFTSGAATPGAPN
jgi:hypothetical protein